MYNATVYNTKLYNQGPFSHTADDDVGVSDSSLRSPNKIITSSLSVVDNISFVKLIVQLVEDTLGMIDTLAKSIMHVESDSSEVTEGISKGFARVVGDSVSIIDTVVKLPGKGVSSLLSITDNLYQAIGKVISDLPTVSDVISSTNTFYRNINDNTSVADAVVKTVSLNIASLVAISDSIIKYVQLTLNSSISLIDSIGKRITKLISDVALSIADLTTVARRYIIEIADALGIVDSFSGLFNSLRVGPAIISAAIERAKGGFTNFIKSRGFSGGDKPGGYSGQDKPKIV